MARNRHLSPRNDPCRVYRGPGTPRLCVVVCVNLVYLTGPEWDAPRDSGTGSLYLPKWASNPSRPDTATSHARDFLPVPTTTYHREGGVLRSPGSGDTQT